MNDAAKIPAIPALIVYEETISPKRDDVIPSVRMSCGPSGITTMKSTMLVNCTEASMRRIISSSPRIGD